MDSGTASGGRSAAAPRRAMAGGAPPLAAIAELWLAGKSAGRIAAQLGLTRGQVLGRVYRGRLKRAAGGSAPGGRP